MVRAREKPIYYGGSAKISMMQQHYASDLTRGRNQMAKYDKESSRLGAVGKCKRSKAGTDLVCLTNRRDPRGCSVTR